MEKATKDFKGGLVGGVTFHSTFSPTTTSPRSHCLPSGDGTRKPKLLSYFTEPQPLLPETQAPQKIEFYFLSKVLLKFFLDKKKNRFFPKGNWCNSFVYPRNTY